MFSCYGHYQGKKSEKCSKCTHSKYCSEASDPELLTLHMASFNEALQDLECRETAEELRSNRLRKINGEKLEYSRNDLLEVIIYMLNLDPLALDLLESKIRDPDISLSDIARQRKTSRQAVQQALKRKCRENPELARLLANREQKNRQRKQITFMEAVCQIRRQKSSMSWNAPAVGSKFYRSLISWNQSLDLSRTNIIKGSSILRKNSI